MRVLQFLLIALMMTASGASASEMWWLSTLSQNRPKLTWAQDVSVSKTPPSVYPPASSLSSVALPEPSGALLVLVGLSVLGVRRPRHV